MNKTNAVQQTKMANILSPAQGLLQRKCACGNHTVAGGECAACAKNKSSLQRKLSIGASNDPLEQEADRVADQVMAAPMNSVVSGALPRIQRYTEQATEGAETAPASVDRVLASSGRPLEPALRRDMGQRFGYDFSQVRVHSDGAAEQSARDVSANAYTVGRDIVFGAGRYVPDTYDGQRLVAHELVHVIQQSRGGEILMRDVASVGLAALPEATRQSLRFDTDQSLGSFRTFFGLQGDPVLANNVDEEFEFETPAIELLKDEKAKKTLRSGLRAYARGLFDLVPGDDGKAHSKRFNLVHVENLDLTRWGGPNTAYRFTCVGSTKKDKITVKILVEQLDLTQQPMAAETATAGIEKTKVTPYGLKRGDAVPDVVWNKVLRSLGKFQETMIMRIRDVTFETSGAQVGASGEAAEFVDRYAAGAWMRRIVLYRKITEADDTAFAFTLAHELGHAIDSAPTQGASGRVAGDVHNDADFKDAAKKDGGRAKAITSYGATSDSEFFAECLAMYVQQPQTMKTLRPNVYAWFAAYDFAVLKNPKLNPYYKATQGASTGGLGTGIGPF